MLETIREYAGERLGESEVEEDSVGAADARFKKARYASTLGSIETAEELRSQSNSRASATTCASALAMVQVERRMQPSSGLHLANS